MAQGGPGQWAWPCQCTCECQALPQPWLPIPGGSWAIPPIPWRRKVKLPAAKPPGAETNVTFSHKTAGSQPLPPTSPPFLITASEGRGQPGCSYPSEQKGRSGWSRCLWRPALPCPAGVVTSQSEPSPAWWHPGCFAVSTGVRSCPVQLLCAFPAASLSSLVLAGGVYHQ